MFKCFNLHNIYCLFTFFCNFILNVKSVPCRGTALYKLQFQGEWTNSSSRPVGAGFLGLIGCTHNKCYRMWSPGEKASLGIKNVAERGDYNELDSEIQVHIDKWKTVLERLQPKNNTIMIGPEAQVILPDDHPKSGFTVDTSRPLVSIIAKIVPSPDWFVGIHDVNLCNSTGYWLLEKRIRLFPYDAGTAERVYNNKTVVERRTISKLQGESISDLIRGMGYIRLVLKQEYGTKAVVVIDEDDCPNAASFRKLSPQLFFVSIVTVIYYRFK